jgi:hypothetical protein
MKAKNQAPMPPIRGTDAIILSEDFVSAQEEVYSNLKEIGKGDERHEIRGLFSPLISGYLILGESA